MSSLVETLEDRSSETAQKLALKTKLNEIIAGIKKKGMIELYPSDFKSDEFNEDLLTACIAKGKNFSENFLNKSLEAALENPLRQNGTFKFKLFDKLLSLARI